MLRQVYQYNTRSSASVNIDSDNMGSAIITTVVSTKEEAEDGADSFPAKRETRQ
jgi:hypothetical protein